MNRGKVPTSHHAGEEVPMLKVQVCLLTFRREELLELALKSILAQTVCNSPVLVRTGPLSCPADVELHILVVDNDAAQTARTVFHRSLDSSGVSARYLCEPRRGLSAARNRALIESADMDYVAFLDDDEAAHPDWLARLLEACSTYDADVATGPVEPHHIQSPPWVIRGKFFSPASRPTGQRVHFVATNNVLLRGSVAARFRFDHRFDDTGGEDTEYFMRIERAGCHMIWVDEARVSECIPATRANMRWLLRRARSDANRYTRSCLSFDPGLRTSILRLITACGGFIVGIILLPGSLFGRHHAVRALQLLFRSIGTLSALRGHNQIYYESTHG